MKLEDQVCSLELSKRMKELGFPQDSLWWWGTLDGKMTIIPKSYYMMVDSGIWEKGNDEKLCSAFTVAELGEMLPEFVWGQKPKPYWVNCYVKLELTKFKEPELVKFEDENFANAMGKMMIYLKEKGLIK